MIAIRYASVILSAFVMTILCISVRIPLSPSFGQVDSDGSSILIILKQSTILKSDGAHIEGQVKNVGANNINSVKILISIYDLDGNFLGTQFAYAEPKTMNPQDISNFNVLLPAENFTVKETYVYRFSLAWLNPDGSVGFHAIKDENANKEITSNFPTVEMNTTDDTISNEVPSVLPQLKTTDDTISNEVPSVLSQPKTTNDTISNEVPSVLSQPKTTEKIPDNDIVARSTPKVTYLGTIGSTGSTPGKFVSPAGIEYVPLSKRLYVSDLQNNRIQIFDTKGHFISTWGTIGNEDGQFNHPGDVAVDSVDGYVYVSDIENNRIQKFDSNGKFLGKWGSVGTGRGQLSHPGDIVIDSTTKLLYITDVHNDRIQKFDSNGNFLASWGSEGTGDGQFMGPTGITIDEGKGIIFVADTGNNRIQKFDTDGRFIAELGSKGEFNRPDGITYEAESDLIYVSDRKNNRILMLTEEGQPFYQLDLSKTIQGQNIKPRDIAIDEAGNLFVVDKDNSKIHVFGSKSSQ